ncbi:kinectin-like [Latimeria chalumnae]|uniref:kinectin-like n=1 Tax=Latimeria chalumnae TaxID=7897 RepID=UPI00313CB7FC
MDQLLQKVLEIQQQQQLQLKWLEASEERDRQCSRARTLQPEKIPWFMWYQSGTLSESDIESVSRELELADALAVDEELIRPMPSAVTEASVSHKEQKKKVEPIPVTKQPTPLSDVPSSKKKPGQKRKKNGTGNAHPVPDVKVESVAMSPKKVEPVMLSLEIKQQESGTGKKATPQQLKKETALVAEREKTQLESVQKTGMKKLKDESDKENAEGKFKDLLVVLKSMRLTEEEAGCLADALKDKSSAIQDIWQKQAGKGDPAVMLHQLQERENLLASAKEEVSIAKEKCKQLNQELLAEKQKTSVVETELQVQYQETKQMQLKLQQLESQTARLQQENNVPRDAVSSASNQMESKQSSEISKLCQDCGRLMAELTEKNNKLQQEEVQKKNAEQTVGQLKGQLQEAERRWEDMQKYLRNLSIEHEKAKMAKQELQTKLLGAESEIQSLHTQRTEAMVSRQQMEERMIWMLDTEQKRATAEDSLRLQVQELLERKEAMKGQIQKLLAQVATQANMSPLVEELQKRIIDKDNCMKQLQESLTIEQVHLTKKEEDFQVKQSENLTLRDEIEKLRAQISEQNTVALIVEQMQKSMEDKNGKIKTIEELLETGLIEMANKEEELKALRVENANLIQESTLLQAQRNKEASLASLVEELKKAINEKDGKIKSIKGLLQNELLTGASKEKTIQALEQKLKESEERHTRLQLECEKYKVVLAETEGILQRLQSNVEEEESRWKLKIEELQKELSQLSSQVDSLEQEKEEPQIEKTQAEDLKRERVPQEMETSASSSEVHAEGVSVPSAEVLENINSCNVGMLAVPSDIHSPIYQKASSELVLDLLQKECVSECEIKKQRQSIRLFLDSLYSDKASSVVTGPLKVGEENWYSFSYSPQPKDIPGVGKRYLTVGSENAESCQFDCNIYFAKELKEQSRPTGWGHKFRIWERKTQTVAIKKVWRENLRVPWKDKKLNEGPCLEKAWSASKFHCSKGPCIPSRWQGDGDAVWEVKTKMGSDRRLVREAATGNPVGRRPSPGPGRSRSSGSNWGDPRRYSGGKVDSSRVIPCSTPVRMAGGCTQ